MAAPDPSSDSGDESTVDSASAAKAAVRARLRAARRELTAEQISVRGRALAQVLRPEVPTGSAVAGYLPMPGEPDVRPFLVDHAEAGGPVYVPVIVSSTDRLLRWVPWSPAAQLRRSAFVAVQEPLGDRIDTDTLRERHPEGLTILVPGLAVDHQGARMGQGGGFYDTAFGASTDQRVDTSGGPAAGHAPGLGPLRFIAVVHSEEVLPPGAFPVEPHDLRVHTIVTEREAITRRPL